MPEFEKKIFQFIFSLLTFYTQFINTVPHVYTLQNKWQNVTLMCDFAIPRFAVFGFLANLV